MMRALVGFVLSWIALKLATASSRLLEPKMPVLPPIRIDVHPELRHTPDRYVRPLVRPELVQVDGLLCLIFGTERLYFDGRNFSKVPDTRWRQ
jgi:hypothetical protein